jgi:hypothetical protein
MEIRKSLNYSTTRLLNITQSVPFTVSNNEILKTISRQNFYKKSVCTWRSSSIDILSTERKDYASTRPPRHVCSQSYNDGQSNG